jgi:hypothetical protein
VGAIIEVLIADAARRLGLPQPQRAARLAPLSTGVAPPKDQAPRASHAPIAMMRSDD